MDKSCVFKTDLLLLVHFEHDVVEFAWILIVALILTAEINQDFIVVGAVLDNFIFLLEFLVILWNDPNYLLDLFRMSAFLFLFNRFGLLVMKIR